jgi:hypothetical protein
VKLTSLALLTALGDFGMSIAPDCDVNDIHARYLTMPFHCNSSPAPDDLAEACVVTEKAEKPATKMRVAKRDKERVPVRWAAVEILVCDYHLSM